MFTITNFWVSLIHVDSLSTGFGTPFIPTVVPDLSPGSSQRPVSPSIVIGDKMPQTRAKVLYDYDAKDLTELSLMSDEIVYVQDIADEDYLMGYRGTQRGKVPKAFLEILLS